MPIAAICHMPRLQRWPMLWSVTAQWSSSWPTPACGWGEMAALRVCDFDMLRRRVNVSRSVTESSGLVWSTPKTHERRSVPFPAALADELSTLMLDKSRDGLVFTDL